ncbi:phosphatidylinositol phosphate kinase [Acrasis kona]|uniref:Phosphatidylinositol phosphate kinase n=1 Tax=Acrasis kona TaxID=1008807 RepID=A0AAW2Z289_9EUKA
MENPTISSRRESYVVKTIAPLGVQGSPNVVSSPLRNSIIDNEQKKKKWHVNGMGSVIYKDHDGFTLMKQIQMGIRTTVSQVQEKKDKEVTISDINNVLKLDFPKKGSLYTPFHQYPPFKFYDYAPLAFRQLRDRFGIKLQHYLISLCHEQSLSILGTPGKSGSLFFFSADMQYIIKTITKAESKFLRKILSNYYNHVMTNPSTLITRFYGLYSIKPQDGRNVRFIVMNNVFDTNVYVEERYDLKGSTVGRTLSEKEKSKQETFIFKDNDFLDKKRKIHVAKQVRDKLMDQLKRDCSWLESVKIMDYSLLLGVHKVTDEDMANMTVSDTNSLVDDSASGPLPPEDNHAKVASTSSTTGNSTLLSNLFRNTEATSTEASPLSKHFHGSKLNEFQKFFGGLPSVEVDGRREIYFVGIIDLLQQWDSRKQLENLWKGSIHWGDKKNISAVSPKLYASRFLQFVEKSFD